MPSSVQRKPKSTPRRKPSQAKRVYSATFSSRVDAVESQVQRILQALGSCGCTDGARGSIEIALREALHNAVLHGNRANPRKCVRVECYEQPDKSLLFVVRDSGTGFNPAVVPDPTKPENLLRDTGRGLFMIRHYMDGVEFSRGGREIRMSKNR
jgi:serine/threonine-protein kinase RsbW